MLVFTGSTLCTCYALLTHNPHLIHCVHALLTHNPHLIHCVLCGLSE